MKNKFAVGARLIVYCGQKVLSKEVLPVRGFQSSVDLPLHFGLGEHSVIDSLDVRWPDGAFSRLKDVGVDRILEIHQDDALVTASVALAAQGEPYFRPARPIPFRHTENNFIDFRVQPLLPRMYSGMGPSGERG